MRFSVRVYLALTLLALEQSACTQKPPAAAPSPQAVAALSASSPRPWIASFSPTGSAQPGSQIRVIFRDDVIPLESLEAPERQAALAHVAIAPALPGRFLFLTPCMLGFSADAPIPPATRVRVTLQKGLTDLRGHSLAADFSWTFDTGDLSLTTNLPTGADGTPSLTTGLSPAIVVTSNAELDADSLVEHTRIVDAYNASAKPIALVRKVQPSPSPSPVGEAAGTDATPRFEYALLPERALDRAKQYRFEVTGGLTSLHGNLPARAPVIGLFATYGPLALRNVGGTGLPDPNGAAGRFENGTPQLTFSNGLDAASAAQAIAITPAPEAGVTLVHIENGATAVTLNPFALRPRTHYTIAIESSLRDKYGQTLAAPASATFDTGRLAGDLWAPAGFNIFPAANDLALNVSTTNLLDARYRAAYHVVRPEELVFTDPADSDSAAALLAPRDAWTKVAAPHVDRAVMTAIPLRKRLGAHGGMLAYGIEAKTDKVTAPDGRPAIAEKRFVGAVQLTNIGVFAQWFPDAGIVRTHRLSDGTPIAGARIAIYATSEKKSAFTEPCATGTTDAHGMLALDGPAFAPCSAASTVPERAPRLLAVARVGDDWAFVRTNEYSGAYDYGLFAGWSAGVPVAHGAIVSDRNLYQPGETAYFTALAYFERNGTLARGRAATYRITMQSPSGNVTQLGAKSPDAYGAFTLSLPLERRQEVGSYSIVAKAGNGEQLDGSFRVAEFKPPNFKVALTLDRAFATAGQSVKASWSSSYLFGATVEGGNAHVDVTRERAYFTPHGREAFGFGRLWSYPEEAPTLSSDVLQADSKIAADGKSAQNVTVAGDLPYPATYRVDAQTTDVSNLSVSDSKTFVALPSDELIGLQSDFVGVAGKPHDVAVIVTDPTGKALTGRRVRVVLQERSYANATQLVEGSETPKDSVHYRDVSTVDVTTDVKPATIRLAPTEPGSYRVRANFADAKSDVTATDADLWVGGPGSFAWAAGASNALTVKLDKLSYRPGETATALVQSPYPQAELFFAVVRHGVLYRKIALVAGAAPEVHFTVTQDMLPNAAVEAVLVRRGSPLERGTPRGLDTLARIGLAPFDVALDAKYLNVTVKLERARAAPQQVQHVALHVTDKAGRGVRTELALAVVNDAILQLSNYRFPDIVGMVYAQQPISTRLADNRMNVKLASLAAPLEKGFGYGGGFEAGAAGTRVRTQFKPIAFYDGAIKTDAHGDASVAFTVPDDLTTWRVMAMAFSADARFGNGENTFLATKPLVTNAVLPQFVRPGDTLRGGLSLTDTVRHKGDATIVATLRGDLSFFSQGTATQTTPRSATAQQTSLRAPIEQLTQAFRFDMRATGTRAASVGFATTLGNERDAFAVPLEIRTSDITESVVQTGTTTDRATLPIVVDAGTPLDSGGLEITLASSLLPETQEAVRVTLQGDAPPFATAIASRVSVAADALQLERRYARTEQLATLQTALEKNLEALRALTLADGGYARWPGAKNSEIYSSAFAAVSLARAKAAGAKVARDIERVRTFLLARLADPTADSGKDPSARAEVRLEALETLGILGELRDDHLSDIFALHERFSYYEQVELARHLLHLAAWRTQGESLRAKLLEAVHETGRAAAVNVPDSSLETATAGQAQLVGLLVDSKTDADLIDRAFRSLLSLRSRNGAWPCPCDNAEAMDAIVAYAALETQPPNFTARAELPGTSLQADFHGSAQQVVTQAIPMAKLPRPGSTLSLAKNGDGTLHYVVAYRYEVRGAQPGRYAGIRFERIVRTANDSHEIARFALAAPGAPPALEAGRVFEIEDRITTDHPISDAIVTDPLPAGLEAVDATFATSNPALHATTDNWEIDYQAIYRDRVLAFAHHLEAGVYAVHYLVRSVTPGTFAWPAGDVHAQYEPEDFGRSAAATLTIR